MKRSLWITWYTVNNTSIILILSKSNLTVSNIFLRCNHSTFLRSLMGLRSELPDRWYEVRIIVERSPGSASWFGNSNLQILCWNMSFQHLRFIHGIWTTSAHLVSKSLAFLSLYCVLIYAQSLDLFHVQILKHICILTCIDIAFGYISFYWIYFKQVRLFLLWTKSLGPLGFFRRQVGHAIRNVAMPCLVILTFSFTIYAIPMSELGSRTE